jgi:hypothetical protein
MPQLLLTNANPLAGTNQERALSDRKNDTPTPAILPDELARMIDTTTVDRGKHNDVDIHLAPCTVKDGEGDRLSPIRNRQHWSPTCWPELLSLLAWPWAIEAGSIESILRSAGCILLTPLAIRACWNIAILLHGIGHTLLIAVVDRKGSALNINNITEHQNLNDESFIDSLSIDQQSIPSQGRFVMARCWRSRSLEDTYQGEWWLAHERVRRGRSHDGPEGGRHEHGTSQSRSIVLAIDFYLIEPVGKQRCTTGLLTHRLDSLTDWRSSLFLLWKL